ncbi:hypothetical protein ACFH04_41930 [Streptomyces noboritoensis]|uniref:Uncharacterized protein n=1 Tax=Streptomyces noboritoensis TaxID=67337 RepID=A0ABV6TWT3_9ACTN
MRISPPKPSGTLTLCSRTRCRYPALTTPVLAGPATSRSKGWRSAPAASSSAIRRAAASL